MNSRFSKENINTLVEIHSDNKQIRKLKANLFGPFMEFGFNLGLILWILIYIKFKFNIVIFFIILFPLIILGLLGLYYSFIKFNKFKINQYKIKINNIGNNFKFIFISDLHLGYQYPGMRKKKLLKLISIINNLNPEVIIFGGDFLCYELEPSLIKELSKFNAKYKFGVYGNHDSDYLEADRPFHLPDRFIKLIKDTGIKLLINEGHLINLNNNQLFFAGIPDLYSKNFNITQAFKNAPEDAIKILISHNPDIIDFIKEEDNIDLILSGHTHSGAIYNKFFGSILPMPIKKRKDRTLDRGLIQINNKTQLFISQGVGYSGTRWRIGTDAEICEIELSSLSF